jgi:hypothetical protein
MTVGDSIENMIYNMMLNAIIESPRFRDYRIVSLEAPNLGLTDLIDEKIKEMVKNATRKKPPAQYDEHVKAYGRFKREEDRETLSQFTSQLSDVQSMVTNPRGFLIKNMELIMPTLTPLLIAAIMPEVMKHIIQELTRPGMPLDPRFTRFLEDEWNSMLARQKQFDTSIGRRGLVVQTKSQWINRQGAGHGSNFKRIAEGTGTGPRKNQFGLDEDTTGSGGRKG